MSKKSLLHKGLLVVIAASGFALAACSADPAPAAAPAPTTTTQTTATQADAATPTPADVPAAVPVAPAAPSNTPAKPAAPAKPEAAKRTAILGPDGFGSLKLGMTAEQALATGRILPQTPGGSPAPCTMYRAPGQPDNSYSVGISDKDGVVLIFGYGGARTPEGIGIGSTRAQVKRAYPKLEDGPNHSGAAVPGHPGTAYGFAIVDDKVTQLWLDRNQNCVG
ncbi:hypothetical protein [Actinokineospora diospyrosa]|uniref:LppP/LprE lipoprotein n=1 Tax=Actinokineospora diospyrosa TaxID=103728 RepID=A0ABT1ICX5_9PSEU|nr:hypothetical protein [Actinokineospora diospyrosa]MCP2270485.1 hypothetical protein [Actinokineospora diospyrosa]